MQTTLAQTPTPHAEPRTDSMVSIAGITKSYRTGPIDLHVLRGIDLEVARGEWIAILGPSGSGKSTLLNILGLLDRPDAGTYRIQGRSVTDLSDDERAEARNRDIGFIFQRFNLLPRTSALENVATPLVYRRGSRRDRLARAAETLAAVGLADRLSHEPSELSGGQIQRVAIARALVTNPALLLADEPTGNLDAESGAEVLELFRQLPSEGRAIIMITHDPDVAALADRQLHLSEGRLVQRPAASGSGAPEPSG